MKQNNTNKSLGPIETNIVSRLTYEKKNIVRAKELDQFFDLSPADRKQIVFRLKKKKILSTIKPGIYVFSPLESGPQGTGVNELLIPPIFFPNKNYYIGYSTMYSYHGFTEQLFQTVYVLNTTKYMEKTICGISYKFIKIPENRFYGIEKIEIKDEEINISSKERTLIDLVYFNKPIGGIRRASEILKEFVNNNKCDIEKLVRYATKFPIIKTRKNIGLILDETKTPKKELIPLVKSIEKTSIISFGNSRRGTINKKWRVIINAAQE